MKKLFFTFVMLLTLNCYSQGKLSYSNELDPLIMEYVNEAAERGLILFDDIVDNVDWIVLTDNLPLDKFGRLDRENRVIYIRNGMEVLTSKITLFHELGHLFTDNTHPCIVCEDIMSEMALEDHSYFKNEVNYEKALDKYFNYLKTYNKW